MCERENNAEMTEVKKLKTLKKNERREREVKGNEDKKRKWETSDK